MSLFCASVASIHYSPPSSWARISAIGYCHASAPSLEGTESGEQALGGRSVSVASMGMVQYWKGEDVDPLLEI